MDTDKINVVPAKETNSLRDKMKDALTEYLEGEHNISGEDIAFEKAGEIADIVFDALGISEAEQDIEGAKVVVNPRVVISINGGCAEVIEGEGQADIEIRDYDIQEDADEWKYIKKDESGDQYQSMKF